MDPAQITLLTRWQIVGDDVMRNVSVKNHFKSGQRIIAQRSVAENSVNLFEGSYFDVIVEND